MAGGHSTQLKNLKGQSSLRCAAPSYFIPISLLTQVASQSRLGLRTVSLFGIRIRIPKSILPRAQTLCSNGICSGAWLTCRPS